MKVALIQFALVLLGLAGLSVHSFRRGQAIRAFSPRTLSLSTNEFVDLFGADSIAIQKQAKLSGTPLHTAVEKSAPNYWTRAAEKGINDKLNMTQKAELLRLELELGELQLKLEMSKKKKAKLMEDDNIIVGLVTGELTVKDFVANQKDRIDIEFLLRMAEIAMECTDKASQKQMSELMYSLFDESFELCSDLVRDWREKNRKKDEDRAKKRTEASKAEGYAPVPIPGLYPDNFLPKDIVETLKEKEANEDTSTDSS